MSRLSPHLQLVLTGKGPARIRNCYALSILLLRYALHVFVLLLALALRSGAQEHQHEMNMAGMYLMHLAAGTSGNPLAWPMPMIMTHRGKWNLMFMASGFLSDVQQSGLRGADKLYS